MRVSELTLAELRLKRAQLARQAAETEGRWRDMPTGPRAVAAGRRLRALEARVADYDEIIGVITSG